MYMKTKKTRTIKMTLQITVLCLFAAAFLLPKGGKSYLMTGIAAAGVLVSLAILIIPPLASGLRKLRLPVRRSTDTGNGNSDLETILIRQISYQITDTLQSAFPEATWEFAEPLRLSHLLDGDAIRLSTRNTGNHNFAEVSMDEYGNLHLQMLTVSCVKTERRQIRFPGYAKGRSCVLVLPDRETIPCGNDREFTGKRTPEAVHWRTGGCLYSQRERAGGKRQAGAFPAESLLACTPAGICR